MRASYLFLVFGLLAISISFSSCNEPPLPDYPQVRTYEVSEVTIKGAVLHGEIVSAGSSPIIEYGFVWDTGAVPNIHTSQKKTFTSPMREGKFDTAVTAALEPNVKYTVKAYAKTADYIVYGQEKTFISLGSLEP